MSTASSSVDLQLSGVHLYSTGRGLTLAYQSFGCPSSPLLLLLMGLGAQMIEWPEEFCKLLAERSAMRVVRFDNRDAGLSTHLSHCRSNVRETFEQRTFDAAPYRIEDLADDSACLIHHLCAQQHHSPARAHIVGLSMGGMVSQEIAIRHPHLVASLCSIMSTTDLHVGSATAEATAVLLAPPPTDRESVVRTRMSAYKVIGSEPTYPTDVDWHRRTAELSFDRSFDPHATARQLLAIWGSPSRTDRLRSLCLPAALVIHGSQDTLITLEGGQQTAEAIPGATLTVFEGMGHDLPQPLWGQIVDEIVKNTRKGDAAAGKQSMILSKL